ncbi:MAG: hypothetical protein IT364_02745 [Candidatus Hydrogenedentes bacterium]|nr:hypothetical protein [Candidatus Hydrogenedentota bacterium]
MSTHASTRSRWMDWKPKARMLAETAESEPTKPSKPGFVGFEGATSKESPGIEALNTPAAPWAEWKAAALNRLFQEQGVIGQPGRITATTVRHGERKAGGNA